MHTPTIQPPAAESVEAVLERIASGDRAIITQVQQTYALVSVGLSYWRGNYKIREAEVFYKNENLTNSKRASKPYWHLQDEAWQAKFQAIDKAKEAVLDDLAVPSGHLRGVRVVFADKLEVCCERLEQLGKRLDTLADEFCSKENYDRMLTKLKEELPAQAYQHACKKIPTRESIRATCELHWHVIPAALPQWALDGDSFQAKEMQKSERRLVASHLAAVTQAPRQRLADAMDALADQLVEPGPGDDWTPRPRRTAGRDSVDALRREVEVFTNFDAAVDDGTLDQVNTLARELDELRQGMEADHDSGAPLRLNTRDYALEWGQKLKSARKHLLGDASMIAGLRKLCAGAGVSL